MARYGNKTNADHIPYASRHPVSIDTDDRIRGQSKGNKVHGDISPPPRDRYYYNTSDHSDDEDDGIESIDGVRFRTQKGASPYTVPARKDHPPLDTKTTPAKHKGFLIHKVEHDYSPPYAVSARKEQNKSPNYEPVDNRPTIDSKKAAAKYKGVLISDRRANDTRKHGGIRRLND